MDSSVFTLTAFCASGIEPVLDKELKKLGFRVSEREGGRVSFESDMQGAARALIGLRTAERIMVRLGRFVAADFDELHEGVRRLPWDDWCAMDDKVVIARVRIHDSKLSAQTSVQAVAHKAIYDRLSARYRLPRLPETGEEREVRLYLEKDVCTIGMDLSGDNLSRRGYRLKASQAPLRETIAAALILISAWRRKHPFRDLLCGSGTIPIEAALFAMDKAPGLDRNFGLETMPRCPPEVFSRAREEARSRIRRDVRVRIRGSDFDPSVIAMAGENARRAGVSDFVGFKVERMEDALPDDSDPGFIISNPPFGLRMGTKEEAWATWTAMAVLREHFTDWSCGFIVDDESFPVRFGARADRAYKLSSGGESLHYYLYQGATSGHQGT